MDTEFDYIFQGIDALWYFYDIRGERSYYGCTTREDAEREFELYKQDHLHDMEYNVTVDTAPQYNYPPPPPQVNYTYPAQQGILTGLNVLPDLHIGMNPTTLFEEFENDNGY